MELKDLDWWDTSLENKMAMIKGVDTLRKCIELEDKLNKRHSDMDIRMKYIEEKTNKLLNFNK